MGIEFESAPTPRARYDLMAPVWEAEDVKSPEQSLPAAVTASAATMSETTSFASTVSPGANFNTPPVDEDRRSLSRENSDADMLVKLLLDSPDFKLNDDSDRSNCSGDLVISDERVDKHHPAQTPSKESRLFKQNANSG